MTPDDVSFFKGAAAGLFVLLWVAAMMLAHKL